MLKSVFMLFSYMTPLERYFRFDSLLLRAYVYMAAMAETKGSASAANTELLGSAETPDIIYTDCLISMEARLPFPPRFGRNEMM